jgi:hypothetical protein
MLNVLARHEVMFLHNCNCAARISLDNYEFSVFQGNGKVDADAYLSAISAHPALGGFYTMDECNPTEAPSVFEKYLRLRTFDPDGITFACTNKPVELFYWRDAADVLSTDPYPLYGLEPLKGYPLNLVADYTHALRETVKDSRPFCTVIQFFQHTSNSRWPTTDELRQMSYMAIVEGANGLFYWSLGRKGLTRTCKPSTAWCPEKEEYFGRLKSVMFELTGLEPALTAIDRPHLLTGNDNPSAIHTRVKFANGKGYLIAYNYTNKPAVATFTWKQDPSSILVYNESRSIKPSKNTFKDSFGAYGAHVYIISVD